ncbi:hypothetical protein KSF78_0001379 [Schistosoma japonicum]|nr:hypothetical protein KSF78_0001379 [Schistosoma japonicum]
MDRIINILYTSVDTIKNFIKSYNYAFVLILDPLLPIGNTSCVKSPTGGHFPVHLIDGVIFI